MTECIAFIPNGVSLSPEAKEYLVRREKSIQSVLDNGGHEAYLEHGEELEVLWYKIPQDERDFVQYLVREFLKARGVKH